MKSPAEINLTHQKAIQLYQQGHYQEGLMLLDPLLKFAKRDPHLHNSIGMFQMALGMFDKATATYKKATALLKTDPQIWANYARALELSDKKHNARKAYEKSLSLNPNNFAVLNNLALILIKSDQLDKVESYLQKAITLAPDQPASYNNLGLYYEKMQDHGSAMAAYQKAVEKGPETALFHFHLAESLARNDFHDKAISRYQEALKRDPNFALCYKSLGRRYMESGHLDLAEKNLRKALSLQPLSDAFYQLASLDVITKDDPLMDQMKTIFNTAGDEDKEQIGFALAKTLDNQGLYDQAFPYLLAANKIKRAKFKFTHKQTERYFRALKEQFQATTINDLKITTSCNITPIFVLGMPRSGTTLVEQILAKHPDIQGAGELTFMEDAIKKYLPGYFNGEIKLDAAKLEHVREYYLSNLQKIAKGKHFVTDKLPLNFEQIGMIKTIFPNAIIIHTKRNPMDVALSCFMQSFGSTMAFIYDLKDIAFYYQQYQNLMSHWFDLFQDDIHTIAYEEIVQNIEGETTSLLKHCGLDYHKDCLSFYEQDRVVNTASYIQVRQPLYQKAINRWHNYENELSDLKADFTNRGVL
ncbi:MAG: sulfotransferase [Methylocystaceae bacterium]|nr:sulfotransferase [Methylocystaceae bacterium]